MCALSSGAYTITLLVMIDRMKGGGRESPPRARLGRIYHHDECTSTSESGHCQSISTLSPVWLTDTSSDMVLYILLSFKKQEMERNIERMEEEYRRNRGGIQKKEEQNGNIERKR
jgi:hypothetical protein